MSDALIEKIARIIAPGAWEEEAVKWHWEMWARDLQFAAKEKARLVIEVYQAHTSQPEYLDEVEAGVRELLK